MGLQRYGTPEAVAAWEPPVPDPPVPPLGCPTCGARALDHDWPACADDWAAEQIAPLDDDGGPEPDA